MGVSKVEQAPANLRTDWRDVPTIVGEFVVGHAYAGGATRLLLGELLFNEDENATMPKIRPTVNLLIPNVAIPVLIAELQSALDKQNGDK